MDWILFSLKLILGLNPKTSMPPDFSYIQYQLSMVDAFLIFLCSCLIRNTQYFNYSVSIYSILKNGVITANIIKKNPAKYFFQNWYDHIINFTFNINIIELCLRFDGNIIIECINIIEELRIAEIQQWKSYWMIKCTNIIFLRIFF